MPNARIVTATTRDLMELDYMGRVGAVTVVTTNKDGKESRQVDWTALALAGALPSMKPTKDGGEVPAFYTMGANVPSDVFTGGVNAVKDIPGAVKTGAHNYPTLVQGRLGDHVRKTLFGAYAPQIDFAAWQAEQDARQKERYAAMAGVARGGMSKSALASLYERMMADPDFADTDAARAFKESVSAAGVDVD